MRGKRTGVSIAVVNVGKPRKENAMRTLARSLSTCALLVMTQNLSAEPVINLGSEVHVKALICETHAKASAVITAHIEQGIDAAIALAGRTCVTAVFIGTPLLVLETRPLGDEVLKVVLVKVRMKDGSLSDWYLPTWYAIKGGKMA